MVCWGPSVSLTAPRNNPSPVAHPVVIMTITLLLFGLSCNLSRDISALVARHQQILSKMGSFLSRNILGFIQKTGYLWRAASLTRFTWFCLPLLQGAAVKFLTQLKLLSRIFRFSKLSVLDKRSTAFYFFFVGQSQSIVLWSLQIATNCLRLLFSIASAIQFH